MIHSWRLSIFISFFILCFKLLLHSKLYHDFLAFFIFHIRRASYPQSREMKFWLFLFSLRKLRARKDAFPSSFYTATEGKVQWRQWISFSIGYGWKKVQSSIHLMTSHKLVGEFSISNTTRHKSILSISFERQRTTAEVRQPPNDTFSAPNPKNGIKVDRTTNNFFCSSLNVISMRQ